MVVEVREKNHSFWGRLWRLPRARVGGTLVVIVILTALCAPLVTSVDPLKQFRNGLADNGAPLPPSANFPLGTDHLGRDILSRLLYGGRLSLFITLTANLVAALLGTLVGVLAGYYSGWIDMLLMRLTDVLLAFPAILLALGIGAVLRPQVSVVILILTVITWPPLARLTRSQTLAVRERQFVDSARAFGATDAYLIIRHILPHVLTVTIVWSTLSIASTVLIESSLSFLGVGVPLPTASWGSMIAEGQNRYRIAPWMILVPSAALLMTTLGFNLIGDAVRDAIDPRTSKK